MLYNSLLLPQLNYCILAWGHNCKRLIKLQKKALRIISISKYNAHTDPLFKKYRILKLPHLLKLQELKCYHKYINKKLPAFLQSIPLKQNKSFHEHLKGHCIEFKYYADGIHSGLILPGNNS